MTRSRTLLLQALLCLVALIGCSSQSTSFESDWGTTADRPWIGPDYWSNPLQDWRLQAGRLENFRAGGDRNVFLLTREVGDGEGDLAMSVRLGRMEDSTEPLDVGWAGFRIGIRGSFDDYRDSAVRGVGLNCGISADGRLFIGNLDSSSPPLADAFGAGTTLSVEARPEGEGYQLTLRAEAGGEDQEVSRNVDSGWLVGGLALVSSSAPVGDSPPDEQAIRETGWSLKPGTRPGGTMRVWFDDWKVSGTKVSAYSDRELGPIMFAMHTLSKGVLKLNAMVAPVGTDRGEATLEILNEGWKQVATAAIDPEARTATFRVADWNSALDTPYRVTFAGDVWEGTVRKDPVDKEELVVAAFTGNNDLGFPHADIVRNMQFHKPDVMAFTGDNIYERVGEYGIVREPTDMAILDYLRKWYIFGWEYGELLRDIPAVALPDDHDVYQGNIWGAAGRKANGYGKPGQDQGGYVMDHRFVHVVQTTQTANMPDPYDATPVEQGIAVYYTDWLYGGVSFAIIADRKWKDSATALLPNSGIVNGWAADPSYDARKSSDNPDFPLLGERQEQFLEAWAKDWDGAWMKAAISQTIFANVCTLPKGTTTDAVTGRLRVNAPGEYAEGEEPVQDHDSNGWPQSGRNRAVRLLRKAAAVHIAGDQHLGSTVQYGVDEWNDSSWAICVPSVANIFPRRWYPSEEGRNRRPGAPRNTGEFLDGFGNKVTVHAVSNPQANGIEPTALFQRAPGYGIVKFRRTDRTIEFANWPRWINASEQGAKPYPGWPIQISQNESGLPRAFTLPPIDAEGATDPVVQVIDESNGEIVFTFRIQGSAFTPTVRRPGSYTVRVIDTDSGESREATGQEASPA
ncbi:MAG: alkaline phosphatase D family protein [Bryobacterales bacterium]|nr:alkaline phosphatase D family protein [Bryobacterales bacterium]